MRMTRVMRNVLCGVFVLGLLHVVHTASFGDEVMLVEDGRSVAPVVLFEDAPPKTRQAVEELVDYIEKISGARPELIDGEPESIPETAIWIGYQPMLDSLFPQTDFDFEHPEEILIAANGDHLVIAGRDRWLPDHLNVEGRSFLIEGFQQEYGTANAVYTFIQDYLDVRWLFPGELGEDIITQETISFEPFEYRYHPQFRLRSGLFRLSALGDGRGHSHHWVRRQRLQLDSAGAGASLLDLIGGHGFGDWWERFGEEHPEYFALQPNGERNGFPGDRGAKLCQSNPAVWDQWLADVEKELEEHPYKTIFNAAPNDSWNRGVCVCENCRAWDVPEHDQWAEAHPEGSSLQYIWEGVSQSYVPMSDRHVTFANMLARKLKERFPDKDYYVLTFAYGASLPAPVEAVPDDNVIIGGVHSALLDYDIWTRPLIGDWGEIGTNFMWRPNTPYPGWRGVGSIAPLTDAARSIKYVAANGGFGIYVDTMWESSWATQGPLYYLMGKLIWNPDQDGQAILDEYYRRGFGDGADEMKAYWALIEQKTKLLYEGGRRTPLGWYAKTYDQAFFDAAYGHLDRAREAVEGRADKYAKRIAFVREGLDFIHLSVEQDKLLVRLEASDGEDAEAKEQAQANWERMREPYDRRYKRRWDRSEEVWQLESPESPSVGRPYGARFGPEAYK